MGEASPWYDLSYLLKEEPESVVRHLLQMYLGGMQADDLLWTVGLEEAERMLRFGDVARLITSTASGDPTTRDDLESRCNALRDAWHLCTT